MSETLDSSCLISIHPSTQKIFAIIVTAGCNAQLLAHNVLQKLELRAPAKLICLDIPNQDYTYVYICTAVAVYPGPSTVLDF